MPYTVRSIGYSTCCSPKEFAPNSTLKLYLLRKRPHSLLGRVRRTSVVEIVEMLRGIIQDETLYDANNPNIVLCDLPLEIVMGVRSFIWSDVGSYVSLHLQNLHTCTAAQTMDLMADTERRSLALGDLDDDTLVSVSKKMKMFLSYRPNVVDGQIIFTWGEIVEHISSYLSSRKDIFFDARNNSIAHIEGDKLGGLFQMKAFHKSQFFHIVKAHLTRHYTRSAHKSEVSVDEIPSSSNDNNTFQPPEEGVFASASAAPQLTITNVVSLAAPVLYNFPLWEF